MNYKNFPLVSKVVFGRGSIAQLNEIISPKRKNEKSPFIYLIDEDFKNNDNIISKIYISYDESIIFISSKDEPKTSQS